MGEEQWSYTQYAVQSFDGMTWNEQQAERTSKEASTAAQSLAERSGLPARVIQREVSETVLMSWEGTVPEPEVPEGEMTGPDPLEGQ